MKREEIKKILKEFSQIHVRTDEPEEYYVISSSIEDDTFAKIADRLEQQPEVSEETYVKAEGLDGKYCVCEALPDGPGIKAGKIIACVNKSQHPTLSESKVMEVLDDLLIIQSETHVGPLTIIGKEKAATVICSLSVVDIAQVGEGDKILKILTNVLITALSENRTLEAEHGTGRVSPTLHIQLHKNEAESIIATLQSLGSERSTQPAAVSEKEIDEIIFECIQWDGWEIIGMNHLTAAKIIYEWLQSLNQKGEGAQERYDKARVYYNTEMGLTGLNASKPELTVINKALHIAAGLPPKPEGGKDEN